MTRPPCWECGAVSDHDHHVVPRSLGGQRTIPLCVACHGKVHGRDMMTTRTLTRAALGVKRERGERTGSVPYGCRLAADGIHLEADPTEARAVALARALRAEGLSLRAIGERLTVAGYTPRGGAAWNPNTIARIAAKEPPCTP